jgi:hypothetical protein
VSQVLVRRESDESAAGIGGYPHRREDGEHMVRDVLGVWRARHLGIPNPALGGLGAHTCVPRVGEFHDDDVARWVQCPVLDQRSCGRRACGLSDQVSHIAWARATA